ncbi:MAG: threonylcarbamoyl-AMP synthase [Ruminococcus sp.]|nr:threonylcarbamoyl-AMP synthase [Ruminococcus sp.]MBR6669469.1 threonylcarbamoyl-AMP synthase [Ruminococcus sp.]
MDTLLFNENNYDQLIQAADMIKNGEVVGMPTETVYGLAANACNPDAVAKIFKAKGRPSDNPLIVHLSSFSDAAHYTSYIPELAYKIADKFCPGPITMIFPKNDKIPLITSGGLDTVGIRIPSHKTARKLIELSGCPIAAPSANTSGYPSPTEASHVMLDMNGKIPAVIDGGKCSCGVESTVISFDNDNTVRILRPGFVTREDLLTLNCNVIVDNAILNEIAEDEKVSSPGMKYTHYSPDAKVSLVEGSFDDFAEFARNNKNQDTYFLIFDNDSLDINCNFLTYGNNSTEQAHNIFACLRKLDELGAKKVFVRVPDKNGIGLAVYNRLIRAAGFEVIKI